MEQTKYKSCKYIQQGMVFYYKHIKFCNSLGAELKIVDITKDKKVTFKEIQKKRLELIEECKKNGLPKECKNCIHLEEKEWESNPKLKFFEFYHWIHCNCGCIYCSNIYDTKGHFDKKKTRSDYYDALPILKDIKKENLISKSPTVSFLGGEVGVLKEFKDIFKIFLNQNPELICVLTSGIEFIREVKNALKTKKVLINISIDSGSKETYKKIKRVDAFDKVISTTKKYLSAAPDAYNYVIFKYILLDNINDNAQEIDKWLNISKSIGMKKVTMSIEFCHSYKSKKGKEIPKHYYELIEYAKNKSLELDLDFNIDDGAKPILDRGFY